MRGSSVRPASKSHQSWGLNWHRRAASAALTPATSRQSFKSSFSGFIIDIMQAADGCVNYFSRKGLTPTPTIIDNAPMTTHNVILPLFSIGDARPPNLYRTLIADPPWRYDSKLQGLRGATNYPTMTVPELMTMPCGLWAETNAHLYLWTTDAFMVQAHQIARAWGFEPQNILVWVKGKEQKDRQGETVGIDPRMSIGFYFRHATESVLFCTRGSLSVLNHGTPNVFYAPRGDHSEKPAAFYDLVAKMSPGPYLDVFARTQRWIGDANFEVMETFGNQAFNFGTTQPPEAFLGAQA